MELNREIGNWEELTVGMIHTFDYFSTKPLVNEAFQVMKCFTMEGSEKVEELIQELLGESDLEAHYEEEEANE